MPTARILADPPSRHLLANAGAPASAALACIPVVVHDPAIAAIVDVPGLVGTAGTVPAWLLLVARAHPTGAGQVIILTPRAGLIRAFGNHANNAMPTH